MEIKYRLFSSYTLPLNEKDKELVIASLTKLLTEPEKLVDGNVYNVLLIARYFDLMGNALNQPDESISLLTEVTGDIAQLLQYGMTEGMLHDRVIAVLPGNFKVYLPPVFEKARDESDVMTELKTNIENVINTVFSDADIEAAAKEGVDSLKAIIIQTALLALKEANAK